VFLPGADLECDPPTYASCCTGTTGVHHSQPCGSLSLAQCSIIFRILGGCVTRKVQTHLSEVIPTGVGLSLRSGLWVPSVHYCLGLELCADSHPCVPLQCLFQCTAPVDARGGSAHPVTYVHPNIMAPSKVTPYLPQGVDCMSNCPAQVALPISLQGI
jgi:hypothetical protein